MADPFIAEIRIVGFNFAPRGWATCDGQLIPISQNTALFSLLGTTYGGDGRSTFALPNLMGRAPMHAGQGPGLADRFLGEQAGLATATLLTSQMPAHTHEPASLGPAVHAATATTGTPSSSVALAQTTKNAYGAPSNLVAMNDATGGDQPHENRQPFLGLLFVIALQGIFPPRP
jgi:microcystin-dependent protein